MNMNKMTQFNPGDTAYTNTVLDNIKGERNVNGGRNILQELLFSPVIAESYEQYIKNPVVVDFLRKTFGDDVIDAIGSRFAKPSQIPMGMFDMSKDTDLQQRFLKSQKYYNPVDTLK